MKTEESITLKLIAHIEAECKAVDLERAFDEMLDECYSFESVGGPFAHMSPSSVLKEVDPIAYRCGVNDYFGCDESYIEVNCETYRKDDVEKARETFIDDLNQELSEIEAESDGLDDDDDTAEKARLERKAQDIKADIETVENHSF